MLNYGRRTSRVILSFLLQTHPRFSNFRATQFANTTKAYELRSPGIGLIKSFSDFGVPSKLFFSYFSSSTSENSCRCSSGVGERSHMSEQENDDHSDKDVDDDGDMEVRGSSVRDEKLISNVESIVGILLHFGKSGPEAKQKLDQCGVPASSELVVEVLSRVRNDWEAAFTFFLWAGKQSGYAHSVREYHSMISILGKMRKFDTAWALVDEMRGGRTGPSMVTPHTLLIMIRRYCAVHDVGKAINTFYALKRFKFTIGIEEFQDLLSALCRYKNVQDAEHLLFCNEKVFPFNTKSFNIVLNGWCNIIVNLREAKRFWREMSRRQIARDTISYASMISCYSKASNLNDVLKLFNQMKELEVVPDRKVYNSVIYSLAKGKLVNEAYNLMKTMEEKGLTPNAVTYNSLIKPLCKARRMDEANLAFDKMLQRGLLPSVRTYHAFFRSIRDSDAVFELLEKMKKTGCDPTHDTYIMLIRKFCRWRQIENVFKLWSEMDKNGLSPDRSSYIVLVHGLFWNGMVQEASKYYEEMKEKGFLPEQKTEEMLQASVTGEQIVRSMKSKLKDNKVDSVPSRKNTSVTLKDSGHEKDFLKQPETRRVTRERGFSFWED